MKRDIVTSVIILASFNIAFAQERTPQYRRSSIYSILVNHTEQKFANEIKDAFLQIPVPDKFNDHNLSVKVLTMDKKLSGAKSEKENPVITEFLDNNKIASRLVARWFNRDFYTGECNMELVKERGLYNASEFDKQLANRSARGVAMLQDAGEELIGNTFVLVNDIRYVDKNKGAKTASSVLKLLGSVASIATGVRIDNLTDNIGDMVESIKGFSVRINSFLYKLEWNDNQANLFYQEQYSPKPDAEKKPVMTPEERKEKARQRSREYQAAHRDQCNAAKKKWYKEHHEYALLYQKLYDQGVRIGKKGPCPKRPR